MTIKDPWRYGFKTVAARNNGQGSVIDWEVDYYLHTHLDGWILKWEVEIPPEGDFENNGDKGEWYRSGEQKI